MLAGQGGPFGAVVAGPGGDVIAEGCNRVTSANDPTAHAEVEAIRAACRALGTFTLEGCTLYTSCEPCPMCLAAAYWARVDTIVFGASRTDAAAAGFDDAFIYDEIGLPPEARRIPMRQAGITQAVALFDEWRRWRDGRPTEPGHRAGAAGPAAPRSARAQARMMSQSRKSPIGCVWSTWGSTGASGKEASSERSMPADAEAGGELGGSRREWQVLPREALVQRATAEEPQWPHAQPVAELGDEAVGVALPVSGIDGAAQDDGIPAIETLHLTHGMGRGVVSGLAQRVGDDLCDLGVGAELGGVGNEHVCGHGSPRNGRHLDEPR